MRLSSSLAAALGALISLSLACAESVPPVEPWPGAPSAPPSAPPPDPPLTPLPPPGNAEIYVATDSLHARLAASHGRRLDSQLLLHDDGTFRLVFSSDAAGSFAYPGRYARADSLITFDFDGWSSLGPWKAAGMLRGDSLSVAYNESMVWSDFVDGTYVRSRGAQ